MKIKVTIKVEPSVYGDDPEEEAQGEFTCEVKSREAAKILNEVTSSLKSRLKTVADRINEQEETRRAHTKGTTSENSSE